MKKEKSMYITPEINEIFLDNEISLILSSEEPPYPADETRLNIRNENPFKDNLV